MGKRRRQKLGKQWWMIAGLAVAVAVTAGLVGAALSPKTPPVTAQPQTGTADYSGYFESDEPAPTKIAFLGDSWTAGSAAPGQDQAYFAVASRALGATYETFPGSGTGYVAANPVSGDGPFITRVPALVESAPDVVVVQGSTNDYQAGSEQEIYDAASEVFASIRQQLPDAQVFALGLIRAPESPDDADARSIAAVSAAAEAHGVTYINGNEPEQWLTIPEDFFDGYHPNAEGHAKLGNQLGATLSELLAS